ncbi:unnamed protein product [Lepeophtheirus salmonis]|uniref:(salmon louse) hypothetical protein n=1 Tax=Lepeophtheirus salmonis TaxID=72036 RepID=A0A7R8D237_LEPSM|nr:unnamed protein product [Lepeophtheirus salmonis]CAF3001925.1 unnamed protein product [Lepeophtheirus salmonis]
MVSEETEKYYDLLSAVDGKVLDVFDDEEESLEVNFKNWGDIQNLDIASMRKGEKMKESVLALSFVESKEDIHKILFSVSALLIMEKWCF